MDVLPRIDEVVIPWEKFIKYALNPVKDPNKALAFQLALGYNQGNADELIKNIRENLAKFPAKNKGNKGYGTLYEVRVVLTGKNGKTANVLTGWIDDIRTGEMRLTKFILIEYWRLRI